MRHLCFFFTGAPITTQLKPQTKRNFNSNILKLAKNGSCTKMIMCYRASQL